MICLDTSVVIAALNGRPAAAWRRIQSALSDKRPIGVSAVVLFELWYGIQKSARPKENTAALEGFLALGVDALPFDAEDAEVAGEVRAHLERVGRPIGPYDILIAAQAVRRDAVLATANMSEFARVPRLRIENWTRA